MDACSLLYLIHSVILAISTLVVFVMDINVVSAVKKPLVSTYSWKVVSA